MPSRLPAPENNYAYGIPINDFEQAKRAMRNHELMLANYASSRDVVKFIPESGTEGNVGAIYRCEAINKHTYTTGKTFKITEISENKVIYWVTETTPKGEPGEEFNLIFEVGREKNAMGKDLFVVRSSRIVCSYLTPTFVIGIFLCFCCCCCFASCVKHCLVRATHAEMDEQMRDIQNYINNYGSEQDEEERVI